MCTASVREICGEPGISHGKFRGQFEMRNFPRKIKVPRTPPPPVIAGPGMVPGGLPQDSRVWRVLSTTDVGDGTQGLMGGCVCMGRGGWPSPPQPPPPPPPNRHQGEMVKAALSNALARYATAAHPTTGGRPLTEQRSRGREGGGGGSDSWPFPRGQAHALCCARSSTKRRRSFRGTSDTIGGIMRVFLLGRPQLGGGGDLVLLLSNEGGNWHKAPCCCFQVDGYGHFLVGSGWLL